MYFPILIDKDLGSLRILWSCNCASGSFYLDSCLLMLPDLKIIDQSIWPTHSKVGSNHYFHIYCNVLQNFITKKYFPRITYTFDAMWSRLRGSLMTPFLFCFRFHFWKFKSSFSKCLWESSKRKFTRSHFWGSTSKIFSFLNSSAVL